MMIRRFPASRLLLSGLFGICLSLVAVAVYYAVQVADAREATPSLVAEARRTYGYTVTAADLSSERRGWLLAVEDPAFDRHKGVDLATPGAGMTTITQALVKILYFPDGFSPGVAKIRQTLIARYALDAVLGKDEQLALFLNLAYFGHRDGVAVHGFSDAAIAFHGKPFESLTDKEFVSLVAMLAGPNTFVPGTPVYDERVARVGAFLSGQVSPKSVLDVEYTGKTGGSIAEEVLMFLLRLMTNASSPPEAWSRMISSMVGPPSMAPAVASASSG